MTYDTIAYQRGLVDNLSDKKLKHAKLKKKQKRINNCKAQLLCKVAQDGVAEFVITSTPQDATFAPTHMLYITALYKTTQFPVSFISNVCAVGNNVVCILSTHVVYGSKTFVLTPRTEP